MRQTSYYGIALGAIVVEKRRGTVSSVKVGTVDRNPPEGAMWTLQFKTAREIADRKTANHVADLLTSARRSIPSPTPSLAALAPIDTLLAGWLSIGASKRETAA